jgi:hypothetical protein
MQHGLNKPLTHAQVKLLGRGFTSTSMGITGQEIKRSGRNPHPTTSAARTRGRNIQYVDIPVKDDEGKTVRVKDTNDIEHVVLTGRKKIIFHKFYQKQPSKLRK